MMQVQVPPVGAQPQPQPPPAPAAPPSPPQLEPSAAAETLGRLEMDWLRGLLTPGALLEAGTKEGRAQWVALLDLLAEAPLEGLVDGDVRVLMACFDVECYIDQLAGASASATTPNTPNTPNQIVTEQRSLLPTDEVASASDEIEALSLTMVHLLCSPPLQPLGQRLVEHLSRAAFPHNLGLALRAVLAAAASGGLQHEWHHLFAKLPMDQLELAQASELLRELSTRPPLAPRYGHGAVCFAHALLLSSPHMPHEIVAELRRAEAEEEVGGDRSEAATTGGAAGDHERGDAAGSLWSELVSFFVGALQPRGGGKAADETFAGLLRLLCQLLEAAPSLIGRVWYLLVQVP
jgi:hypothetical protein